MDTKKIDGCESALRCLAVRLSKCQLTILAAAAVAKGIIVVLLSNHCFGILFRTHIYGATEAAIRAAGGPEEVTPEEWANLKLGYIWTRCCQIPPDIALFRDNYVKDILKRVDGQDIAWFPAPALIFQAKPLQATPSTSTPPPATPTVLAVSTPGQLGNSVPGPELDDLAKRLAALDSLDLGIEVGLPNRKPSAGSLTHSAVGPG